MAEEKQEKTEGKENKSELANKLRENPWIISSIVLGIVVLILLVMVLKPGLTGNVINGGDAGANLISFAQGQGVALEVVKVTDEGSYYNVEAIVNGQNGTYPVTKDGKFMIGGLYPLTGNAVNSNSNTDTTQTQPTEVPKSDKVTAELYIFSYCPAGTAALDSFAQTGKLLYNAVDMKVKFFSNMHGEHEKQQNMIQECIQKIANAKYWDYASQYVTKIYNVCGSTRDISCDKNESIKLMKSVGIDSDAVMTCVAQNGASLYEQDQVDAGALNLQYSPSVVINGVYDGNADRTPEGLKSLICSSFNTAPAECSQSLSTTSTTSSGSCS